MASGTPSGGQRAIRPARIDGGASGRVSEAAKRRAEIGFAIGRFSSTCYQLPWAASHGHRRAAAARTAQSRGAAGRPASIRQKHGPRLHAAPRSRTGRFGQGATLPGLSHQSRAAGTLRLEAAHCAPQRHSPSPARLASPPMRRARASAPRGTARMREIESRSVIAAAGPCARRRRLMPRQVDPAPPEFRSADHGPQRSACHTRACGPSPFGGRQARTASAPPARCSL